MNIGDYLKDLEIKVKDAREALNRLELKLETAREMAALVGGGKNGSAAAQIGTDRGLEHYRGMAPSAAIIAYLRARGRSKRVAVIDQLAPLVRSKSDKPRNVVRTCIKQLVQSEQISLDGETIAIAH